MNFFKENIYFPRLLFLIYAFLIVLALTLVIKAEETKYTIDRIYNIATQNTVTRDELDEKKTETVEQINISNPRSKYEADLATLVLWGIVGGLTYWLCYFFYKSLIQPFLNDNTESHYIHASKQDIVKRRALWATYILITFILIVFTFNIFRNYVLGYYEILTYATTLFSLALFLFGVFLVTMLLALIVTGINLIVRTS